MRADMKGVGVRTAVGVVTLAILALGCPGEKRPKGADSARTAIPVDTTPTDLSKVQTSLPPPAPDTFKGPAQKVARKAPPPVPSAPPALMEMGSGRVASV